MSSVPSDCEEARPPWWPLPFGWIFSRSVISWHYWTVNQIPACQKGGGGVMIFDECLSKCHYSFFKLWFQCVYFFTHYSKEVIMLSISSPDDLADKIDCNKFYLGSHSCPFHGHENIFSWPIKLGLLSFQLPWQFHWPWNLMIHVSWPINLLFLLNQKMDKIDHF